MTVNSGLHEVQAGFHLMSAASEDSFKNLYTG